MLLITKLKYDIMIWSLVRPRGISTIFDSLHASFQDGSLTARFTRKSRIKSVAWLPTSEGLSNPNALIDFFMTLFVVTAFLSLEGNQVAKIVRIFNMIVRRYDELFISEL